MDENKKLISTPRRSWVVRIVGRAGRTRVEGAVDLPVVDAGQRRLLNALCMVVSSAVLNGAAQSVCVGDVADEADVSTCTCTGIFD